MSTSEAVLEPWQWPEEHWRKLVNHVRAGRKLRPNEWPEGARCAVARSILVVIWHLLPNPDAQFCDLGPDFYDKRIGASRHMRNHIAALEALSYKVTLEPAARPSSPTHPTIPWSSHAARLRGFSD